MEITLEELQQKYIDETNTDKIILVNPEDLTLAVDEELQPEKSSESINEIYSRNSLASPILASAKHEVIISTDTIGYSDVDTFIEKNIEDLNADVDYLTIVSSPNAIEMSYEWTSPNDPTYTKYYSADFWFYSKIDEDPLLDLAVGRIFGLTVSDVSSNIARRVFYKETIKNRNKVLVTRGLPFITTAARVYAMGKVFEATGYDTITTPASTIAEDWEDNFCDKVNEGICDTDCDNEDLDCLNKINLSNQDRTLTKIVLYLFLVLIIAGSIIYLLKKHYRK